MENATRKVRPKYLDLLRLTLPATGWVSIAHRISGVVLVLFIPLILYGLDVASTDPAGFVRVQLWCKSFPGNFFVFVGVLSLAHHLLAGARFLLLDAHIGAELAQARRVARMILLADGVFMVLYAALFFI